MNGSIIRNIYVCGKINPGHSDEYYPTDTGFYITKYTNHFLYVSKAKVNE